MSNRPRFIEGASVEYVTRDNRPPIIITAEEGSHERDRCSVCGKRDDECKCGLLSLHAYDRAADTLYLTMLMMANTAEFARENGFSSGASGVHKVPWNLLHAYAARHALEVLYMTTGTSERWFATLQHQIGQRPAVHAFAHEEGAA